LSQRCSVCFVVRTSMEKAQRKGFLVHPDQGRTYPMGRMRAIFKVDGEESGGSESTLPHYSVSEWWLEPRTHGPGKPHHHPEDHVYYVITGTLSVCLDGTWSDAEQGTYIVIPGGVQHTFENRSNQAAVGFITFNTPGGFERKMASIAPHLAAQDLNLDNKDK
jgi:quercetin dioxygenase-like cupin family protein